MDENSKDIQSMKCVVDTSVEDFLTLCRCDTETTVFMYRNNETPKRVSINHRLEKDGSQDEKIDLFKRLVDSVRTSNMMAFIVALHVGGEMGSPDINVEDAFLVFATCEREAEDIYNKCTKAVYYKGYAIAQVTF